MEETGGGEIGGSERCTLEGSSDDGQYGFMKELDDSGTRRLY